MEYGYYEVNLTSSDKFAGKGKQKRVSENKNFIPIVEKKEPKNDNVLGYYVETSDDVESKVPATNAQQTVVKSDDDDKNKTKKTDDSSQTDEVKVQDDEPDESETSKDEDEDIMGHEVDQSVRIHTIQSIAKHNTTENPVRSALRDAVYQDVKEGDDIGKNYINAMEMLKENKESNPLENVDTDNKVKVYGKLVNEYSDYKLIDENVQYIKSNTQNVNLGISWGKKSKKGAETKVMFFGSFAHNFDKVKLYASDADTPDSGELNDDSKQEIAVQDAKDNESQEENAHAPIVASSKSNDYKIFGALNHKFVNEDELTSSVQLYNDGSTASTLLFNNKYVSNKYDVYAQASVSVYMEKLSSEDASSSKKNTVVTNLKVGLNSEADESDDDYKDIIEDKTGTESENNNESNDSVNDPVAGNGDSKDDTAEPAANNIELNEDNKESNDENKTVTEPEDNKKWSKLGNPYLVTTTIAGEPSTGLGFEQYYKRKSDNSRLTLGYFAQGSVTHVTEGEEKSQEYNLAFGASLKHVERINDGILESKVKIRDRYTFGKSNIFTAGASVEYTNKNLNAELSAEYVKVPNSTYFGIDGRIFYNIGKKIGAFLDASYIHLKQEDLVKGSTIQAGVILNL